MFFCSLWILEEKNEFANSFKNIYHLTPALYFLFDVSTHKVKELILVGSCVNNIIFSYHNVIFDIPITMFFLYIKMEKILLKKNVFHNIKGLKPVYWNRVQKIL